MRLAREKGADGYFFLNSAGLALDPHTGMAHALLSHRWKWTQSLTSRMPRPHQLRCGG
jgi:hypothetical protein